MDCPDTARKPASRKPVSRPSLDFFEGTVVPHAAFPGTPMIASCVEAKRQPRPPSFSHWWTFQRAAGLWRVAPPAPTRASTFSSPVERVIHTASRISPLSAVEMPREHRTRC